jgi:hypothetical protein
MKKVYYFLYGFLNGFSIIVAFFLLYSCHKIIELGAFGYLDYLVVATALLHIVLYFVFSGLQFAIYLKERK